MRKRIFIIITLFLIFAFAFFLRVHFCEEAVFSSPVKYAADDGVYHMRLVENELLGNHFPKRIYFDPYTYFPYGSYIHIPPLYTNFLAAPIWLIGLGKPSLGLINGIAPFLPAIFGSFIIFIAYFAGKKLWSRKVGLLSAFFASFYPTFLYKSLLGAVDHHFAEVLVSSLTMMFLIFALKEKKFSKKFWLYTALTGVASGIYLLVWRGAVLFFFIIASFIFLYFLIEYLSKRSTPFWILRAGLVIFAISLLMLLPYLGHPDIYHSALYGIQHLDMLILGILGFVSLEIGARFLDKRKLNRWFILIFILGLSFFLLLIMKVFFPMFFWGITSMVRGVDLGASPFKYAREIVGEMRPLGFEGALNRFSYSFYLALLGLVLVLYNFIRKRKPEQLLVVWWTIIIALSSGIIPVIGQNRFAYYLFFNVSLLTAFLVVRGLEFGWNGLRKAEALPKGFSLRSYLMVGSILVIFNIIFFSVHPFPLNAFDRFPKNRPDIMNSVLETAKAGPPMRVRDWYDTMTWLRKNTPDPGLDYYAFYKEPGFNKKTGKINAYQYPKSAYGILARWDIGHMITYYAHRLPVANPDHQGIGEKKGDYVEPGEATFFLETDEKKAIKYLDELRTRYVITDYSISNSESGFKLLIKEIEGNLQDYTEAKETKIKDNRPSLYDDSMIVRLHRLDGNGFKDKKKGIKILPLDYFRLVWESRTTGAVGRENPEEKIKMVKIFEYVKGAKIKGRAPKGTKVSLSSEIETNQERKFTYSKELEVGDDGSFEFIVPYSTQKEPLSGQTKSWVFASPYKLKIGDKEKEIQVSEENILEGNMIEVVI